MDQVVNVASETTEGLRSEPPDQVHVHCLDRQDLEPDCYDSLVAALNKLFDPSDSKRRYNYAEIQRAYGEGLQAMNDLYMSMPGEAENRATWEHFRGLNAG